MITLLHSSVKRGVFLSLCICAMLLSSLVGATGARAQGVSSLGTDFWFGFMPNYNVPATFIKLFVASGTKNTFWVEYWRGSSGGGPVEVKRYDIEANAAITVRLDPAKAETWEQEKAQYGAVRVRSVNPIVVYGFSTELTTSDGFLALPVEGLGKSYYTANYWDDDYFFVPGPLSGEFLIVAPYNNTNVKITTKANTKLDAAGNVPGHKEGDTWNVTLQKGQVYLVQTTGKNWGIDDLTGSYIESDKPIGVLSGHQRCTIPLGEVQNNHKDHLIEMLPSIDRWGTQYFDRPMATRNICGDMIRFISAEDNNVILINGEDRGIVVNKGEWFERENVREPEVYTSRDGKKFLTLQYSYSGDYMADPAQADPFMIVMTPQRQFQKKIIFRVPKTETGNIPFDNYITVVCEADSLRFGNITINGQPLGTFVPSPVREFAGTAPKMGAVYMRLPGTEEKTYIIESPTPMGVYTYGFSNYDSYGWPAGMALNIESADTLPPLAYPEENCGNYDVTLKELRHMPEFSFEDTRISLVSMILEPNDVRWPKPSFNYTLEVDPNFIPGDSITSFKLRIVDPFADAYAAIFTQDLAGNDTVYEYFYSAPKITLDPKPGYDLGAIIVDQEGCLKVKLTNNGEQPLRVKGGKLSGTAKGGTFKVTPNDQDQNVAKGESLDLNICFTPTDTLGISYDTLKIEVNCIPLQYVLTAEGVTPLIYAEDLNFGYVQKGNPPVCKTLKVSNPGRSRLVINSQDLPTTDPNFSIDAGQTFPIVLEPKQSTDVKFCFHPATDGNHVAVARYLTNHPARYARAIKDTSILRGTSATPGAKLTVIDTNFGNVNCLEKPTYVDVLYNDNTAADLVLEVKIEGENVPGAFKIVRFTSPTLTNFQLDTRPGFNGYEYEVQFDPSVGPRDGVPRTAILKAYTQSGSNPITTIKATAVEPVLGVTPGTPIDIGTVKTGATTTGQFTIENKGTDVLNVTTIAPTPAGIDQAQFSFAPQPPFALQPGAKQVITVTFTGGTESRQYNVTYLVTPEACAAPLTQPVTASVTNVDFVTTGADYGTVFTCRTKDLSGSFTNLSSNDAIRIVNVDVVAANGWNDPQDFSLVNGFTQVDVAPKGTLDIPVQFMPTQRGVRRAALRFSLLLKGQSGQFDQPVTQYELLTGIGKDIPQVFGVGNTTAGVTYEGRANDEIDVKVVLANPFAGQTTEVFGYTFTLSWKRDAFSYVSEEAGPLTITHDKTKTTYNDQTGMETHVFKVSGTQPLTDELLAASIKLRVMLTTSDVSDIIAGDARYFDQSFDRELCYINTTYVPGKFSLNPVCEDVIRGFLDGNALTLSVRLVQKVTPGPVGVEFTNRDPEAAVTVTLVSVDGREVARLLDGARTGAGTQSLYYDGRGLPSGVYFVRVSDGHSLQTERFVVRR